MSNKNLEIWNANRAIPTEYTKGAKLQGQHITTFSLASVVEMATAQFGPIGKGWGYEIELERDDEGAIIQNAVTHENGDTQPEVREVIHTLIIRLWYMDGGEKVIMPVQAGHTPKMMRTKYGPSFDSEYYKKTLADAIKKSLSMLGFGADIFLGLMDDPFYQQQRQEEAQFEVETQRSNRIQELTELVKEYATAYKANNMPHSLKAQLGGHKAEVNRFAKRWGIDPAPYIAKLENSCAERLEEFKTQKESDK